MKTSSAVMTVLMLALAGCAGGSKPAPASAPAPVRTVGVVRVPQVMAPRGLGGVIGQEADLLTRRFGNPRIDLAEGDARKLQFSSGTCVLDIYLYPMSPGAAPTAAHVDARLRQGGAATDPGACIREVEAR